VIRNDVVAEQRAAGRFDLAAAREKARGPDSLNTGKERGILQIFGFF
jgi:hypothetical protein